VRLLCIKFDIIHNGLIMNVSSSFPVQIHKLLQSNTIMSLKEIRDNLGGRARSSLFRDLTQMDVIASYTHTGQYHALRSTAKFDMRGLWFINNAGFSKYGTLRNTLIQIIAHANTGMTQKELKSLLRIKVQNTLTDLVKSNGVVRELLPYRVYVYLSTDEKKAADQLQRRLAIHEKGPDAITLPAESLRIEILLELIRGSNSLRNEKELGARLRKRGVAIQDAEIAYVLAYYDIKKKLIMKS